MRQAKSKVKSMPIIFFDIKGIVHKEFILAGQTVILTYHCDILQQVCENMRKLHPEVRRQKNWLLHYGNALSHFLFYRGIFGRKQHSCYAPPTLLFSVSPIEDKTEDCHFDAIEVIEAELQAVLNTLTDHNFQDAFKNGRSSGNGAYAHKRTTSRVMVASRPKVSF
jgi:hypothetical protein